jgi:phosphatidylserine/phosphatidylglycerophosphate/cardiolipin synthase-like enzyme
VQLAIVDGEWFTGGSANLVDLSMEKDHTELNISVWDQATAMRLLTDLSHEHTGGTCRPPHPSPLASGLTFNVMASSVATEGMTDVEMVATVQRVARTNLQALLRRALHLPHFARQQQQTARARSSPNSVSHSSSFCTQASRWRATPLLWTR